MLRTSDALLIVDPQNDFMPGGSLAVSEGDQIFMALNPLVHQFDLVIASQDWHPVNHISFVAQGGPWLPHCLQGTKGADFHRDLDQSRLALIVRKGFDPQREQYSCFDQTGLAKMLLARGVERIFVGGVATDYCVLNSVLGALEGGLKVQVLLDCIRAVNVKPDDGKRALENMQAAGAALTTSKDISSGA